MSGLHNAPAHRFVVAHALVKDEFRDWLDDPRRINEIRAKLGQMRACARLVYSP